MVKYLNVKEAAEKLGVSEMTVRRYIKEKEFSAYINNKRHGYAIKEEDLQHYIEDPFYFYAENNLAMFRKQKSSMNERLDWILTTFPYNFYEFIFRNGPRMPRETAIE